MIKFSKFWQNNFYYFEGINCSKKLFLLNDGHQNKKSTLSKHLLVLKTSWRHILKTSSTRLQRNNFLSSKTSWRRLEDIWQDALKTSLKIKKLLRWRRLEDMSWRRLEDMSWRRLEDISWRHLQDMSWRRLQNVLETNKLSIGDICI